MYFYQKLNDKNLAALRQELPCKVDTDEYPLPIGRFMKPLEKILQRRTPWDPHKAVDVCCNEENHRYQKYLTDSFDVSWCDHGKFIWCMTPYSDNQQKWAKKCIHEANKGAIVVALYAFRENKPWKWLESMIFGQHFNISMGRVRIDYWPNSNYDHLLVIYGLNNQTKRLRKDLALFRQHLDAKLSIKSCAVLLNITVEMCIRICNKIGLLNVTGRRPITDGRNKILRHEYDYIKAFLKEEIRTQEKIIFKWGFDVMPI